MTVRPASTTLQCIQTSATMFENQAGVGCPRRMERSHGREEHSGYRSNRGDGWACHQNASRAKDTRQSVGSSDRYPIRAVERPGRGNCPRRSSRFEAVNEALKGITGAYFVYPIQVPGILDATAFFAQAALEQGVGAIVNMSQISSRRIAKSHAAQNHWIAECLLDRSGIPVTHLRPTFFAECLTYLSENIREKNMFPLPFGSARYAPIAAEDQGRVIAAILNDSAEHAGKIYPLYGPKELTQYEGSTILTQVLGKKITPIPAPIPPFLQI